MKRRELSRSLGIAARARQWLLDDRSPALREARAAEDHARARHQAADLALTAAHSESQQLLGRPEFRAGDLSHRSSFEGALRKRVQQARSTVDEAQAGVDAIRAEMHDVLSQRDAYRQRLTRLQEDARVQQQRRETRAVDELWSLGGSSERTKAGHED